MNFRVQKYGKRMNSREIKKVVRIQQFFLVYNTLNRKKETPSDVP